MGNWIPDGYIIVAACKDDCRFNLSEEVMCWFASIGSNAIWRLKNFHSFAFIGKVGRNGHDECIEGTGKQKNHQVTL